LGEDPGLQFALTAPVAIGHAINPGGATVRKTFAFVLATFLISVTTVTWAVGQQSRPVPDAASIDKALQTFRADLQSNRSDLIAKNITLTTAQAAKFWPMFEVYQKEQNVIMDDQMKSIQHYVETYETLDDAGALSMMKANFDRDDRMNALRKKWLAEFQTIVGTKLTVRVMQIDRQLSMAHQLAFATQIPLVR